jgi:hypothetical protein
MLMMDEKSDPNEGLADKPGLLTDFSRNRFVPDGSTRTSIHRSRRSLRYVTRV